MSFCGHKCLYIDSAPTQWILWVMKVFESPLDFHDCFSSVLKSLDFWDSWFSLDSSWHTNMLEQLQRLSCNRHCEEWYGWQVLWGNCHCEHDGSSPRHLYGYERRCLCLSDVYSTWLKKSNFLIRGWSASWLIISAGNEMKRESHRNAERYRILQ